MRRPGINRIYIGDCLETLRSWPDNCVQHCIADPPFRIASNGKSGLGWAFSSHVTMHEAWDSFSKEDEYFQFTIDWLKEVCRVVQPNGNILIFGTYHNIYLLGFVLADLLKRRLNSSIIWYKPNAQPNITTRSLTESTEQILWAVNETPKRATRWTFNYWDAKALNGEKQLRNVWDGGSFNVIVAPVVPASERRLGRHPAQKPRALIDRLIHLFTNKEDVILDPFAGTGVVALSAAAYLRRYILIEKSAKHARVAEQRILEQRRSPEIQIIRRLGDRAMTLNDRELRILQKVPVPQADDLDKIFSVLELVEEGYDTADELAEQLDMVGRQGTYYADAAVALRLVEVRKDITVEGRDRFHITEVGRQYLDASVDDRPAKKRLAVLTSPILKYVSSRLGVTQNGAHVPYPPPAELQDESIVAPVLRELGLTGNTPHRRAQTLKAWLAALT